MASVIVMPKIMFSSIFKLYLQVNLNYSLLFMKYKFIPLIAASLVMLLSGCKDDKPKYGAPMTVKVFGVTGRLDLEPGSQLGLTVSDPVDADNVRLTVSDKGQIIPEKEIKWGYDQSSSSRFFAYYPYDASYSGQETVTVKTPADQSTAQKMLKGNLLTAVASGGPKESSVTMKLTHAMSAMSVSFDNRTGEKITSMTVNGFMTEGKLNFITGALVATGVKMEITPMRSPADDNTFSFIYIPQDVSPYFTVTLASGKKMTFTFDNYCHEYPGKILKLVIQFDSSTPEANILPLTGMNMTQWTTNGIPQFSAGIPYVNLAGLKTIQPEEDGYFEAYINMATVTAVDETSSDVKGVILEDESAAIHTWAYYNSPLEVGSTVIGLVAGFMDKPSDDEFHIFHFYVNDATVGKTDELPYTLGRFDSLVSNIGNWDYRRMQFRNVTLKEAFDNGRAVFEQGNTSVSVVCPGLKNGLVKGAKGDLIGFPVSSGSDIMIMVYDFAQFESFTKDATDNVLTRARVYGLYDISAPDTAVYTLTGKDADVQYSMRIFDYGRTMQVADTRNDESQMFLLYDCDVPVVGHEYKVAYVVSGKTEKKGSTLYMECIKVDDNTAWLVDRSGTTGLVLAL